MKQLTVLSVVAVLTALAAAQTTAPSSDQATTAARSVAQSAQSLALFPATPSQPGRFVTLVKCAYQLDGADPQAQKLMSDIHEIGDMKAAGELALKRLAAQKDNYVLGLSYLRLNLESLSNAKDRLDFLHVASQNKDLTPYIRAEALVQSAEVLMRQDQKKQAMEKLKGAIELDPRHPIAMSGLLQFKDKATLLEQVKTMLELLKSNPNDTDVAWNLAVLLDSAGLYSQALVLYDYGWLLTTRLSPESIDEGMAINYINGLLDGGQANKALEIFVPLRKRLGDSPEFKSLLIEAYRDAGNVVKVNQMLDELKVQMGERGSLAGKNAEVAKETAWYFLINNCYPNAALGYAREATKLAQADDPSLQLILAAAQLRAGDAAAGEAALKKLLDKDVYAACFLAQYYYENNKPDEGKKALLAGSKMTHRGRAYRGLAGVARRQNVELPAAEGSKEIAQVVEKFDEQYLAMGQSPENFITVKLSGLKEEYAPGEAIQLEATLTNASKLDIRLGGEPPLFPSALFIPAMTLQVNLDTGQEFMNLPMVVWPAHRYLKAGDSLTTTIRLDAGELEHFLARHPLEKLAIRVSGTLDPYQKDGKKMSMLPTFRVPPVTINRTSILIEFDRAKGDWENAYEQTLGYIVKDLKQGDVGQRMVAARKIGSLLALVGDVQSSRADLPKQLTTKVKQPVLLTMLKFTMQDESPLVRAEMVRSLNYCRMDNRIWQILKPFYGDKSELVRLRFAELLGINGQFKDKNLFAQFNSDRDPFVKQMTAVFK